MRWRPVGKRLLVVMSAIAVSFAMVTAGTATASAAAPSAAKLVHPVTKTPAPAAKAHSLTELAAVTSATPKLPLPPKIKPAAVQPPAPAVVPLTKLTPQALPAATPGCSDTWIGPDQGGGAGGDFGTASNWSLGTVPTVTDYACIPAGTAPVTVDGGASIEGVSALGVALIIPGGGGCCGVPSELELNSRW
jgi:hypothetical protein